MITLTKEWLLKTIAELEEERDATPGTVNEDAAMALAAMKIALASLEAEPVAYMWDSDRKDVDAAGYYRPEHKIFAESSVKRYGGKVVALFAAPPAPVVPATLPCAVELKPGFIIGKGCKTATLLTALQRRADYYAKLEVMTPEERADHDAGIEEFKAMLPQPAPVVPTFDEWLTSTGRKPVAWVREVMEESYNACRAAMKKDNDNG